MVPSAILFTSQPACVHVDENPLNTPALGWVTTTLSTMIPDPTGTSAVFAIAFAACDPEVGAAVDDSPAAVDESPAVSFFPYVVHAANTVAASPIAAPMRAFCRGMRTSAMFTFHLSLLGLPIGLLG
jgi:hypothetical protein